VKINFLGTGTSQGVPVIACDCEVCLSANPKDARLRSSVMVEVNGEVVVIDTGPDFRQQMLRAKASQLDAVVFTHEHKDHIAGLDDVRAFNFKQKKAMNLYGTEDVEDALKRDFHYAFADNKYPGVPDLVYHRISNEPFDVGDIVFTPIQVMHYRMPVLGFRIEDFTYITDANFISEEEKEKIHGSKVLVLNALRKDLHISHFNLDQAIKLVQELKPEAAYFTHISHLLGKHEEVSAELPENIHLAFDGLCLELNRS
jgi:phosphoribosyl 1,2-cyclic phosphate phosphodiesterase